MRAPTTKADSTPEMFDLAWELSATMPATRKVAELLYDFRMLPRGWEIL